VLGSNEKAYFSSEHLFSLFILQNIIVAETVALMHIIITVFEKNSLAVHSNFCIRLLL